MAAAALLRRHIRHCSLNMTFLCLQVDGVVTDVEIFPVRLLLPPGRGVYAMVRV